MESTEALEQQLSAQRKLRLEHERSQGIADNDPHITTIEAKLTPIQESIEQIPQQITTNKPLSFTLISTSELAESLKQIAASYDLAVREALQQFADFNRTSKTDEVQKVIEALATAHVDFNNVLNEVQQVNVSLKNLAVNEELKKQVLLQLKTELNK